MDKGMPDTAGELTDRGAMANGRGCLKGNPEGFDPWSLCFRSWYQRQPQLEEYVPLCHEGNSGEGDENVCIVIGSNTH